MEEREEGPEDGVKPASSTKGLYFFQMSASKKHSLKPKSHRRRVVRRTGRDRTQRSL